MWSSSHALLTAMRDDFVSSTNQLMISVIMTSYNYAAFIREAVESVWVQTYPNVELVIVDDASKDDTLEILKDLQSRSPIPMRVYKNETNMGPNYTQNRAIAAAQGDLIAFLASDDKFFPSRFETQVNLFQRQEKMKIVYGNGWRWDGKHNLSRLHGPHVVALLQGSTRAILRYLYTNTSPLFLQTALMRRDFFLACGGNDESVLADDWVLNIRFFERLLQEDGTFGYVDEDLAYYRVHGNNLHQQVTRHRKLKEEVVEKYTPQNLKREALANIYWKDGIAALDGRRQWEGVKLLALSAYKKATLKKVAQLLFHLLRAPLKQ